MQDDRLKGSRSEFRHPGSGLMPKLSTANFERTLSASATYVPLSAILGL